LIPGASDDQEVDVDEPVADVIALDLARDREVRLAVHLQVHQDVRARGLVEQVDELAGVHREGHGVLPVAVEHGRDPSGGAQLARGALAGAVSALRGQFGLSHGRSRSSRWGSAGHRIAHAAAMTPRT
jgi:hypothetical protein